MEEFFNKTETSATYKHLKTLTRGMDLAAAEVLNREVRGRVLSIGGVWECFQPGPELSELTCLDLSEEMLKSYAPAGAKTVVGDLFHADLPAGGFDSVVFALILHHLAQDNTAVTRQRVAQALGRALRWLKPGGRVFIIEPCPAPAWMPLQKLALPFTKLFLRLVGQPLVFMHERAFYESVLPANGFSEVSVRRFDPPNEWVWFPVFIGASWPSMPLKFYPKLHLITGRKPASP